MPVKPIDLQTNIAQMFEIAKGEDGKSTAIMAGRHVLEMESSEKSRLVNTKLYENKKLEKISIKREEERKKRGKSRGRSDETEVEIKKKDKSGIFKDDKIGVIIDIKK